MQVADLRASPERRRAHASAAKLEASLASERTGPSLRFVFEYVVCWAIFDSGSVTLRHFLVL